MPFGRNSVISLDFARRRQDLSEPSASDWAGAERRNNHDQVHSALCLLEDACSVAGMQSVEYARGYTCQFAHLRAGWRESAFTRPGQNCSLSLSLSWTRGCLSATIRKP